VTVASGERYLDTDGKRILNGPDVRLTGASDPDPDSCCCGTTGPCVCCAICTALGKTTPCVVDVVIADNYLTDGFDIYFGDLSPDWAIRIVGGTINGGPYRASQVHLVRFPRDDTDWCGWAYIGADTVATCQLYDMGGRLMPGLGTPTGVILNCTLNVAVDVYGEVSAALVINDQRLIAYIGVSQIVFTVALFDVADATPQPTLCAGSPIVAPFQEIIGPSTDGSATTTPRPDVSEANCACPDDCTDCDNTIPVDLSGGTSLDSAYSMHKTGASCSWLDPFVFTPLQATLYCDTNYWYVRIADTSDLPESHVIARVPIDSSGCPPTGTYTIYENTAGGTAVVTVG
jgi:hypothetical protein